MLTYSLNLLSSFILILPDLENSSRSVEHIREIGIARSRRSRLAV